MQADDIFGQPSPGEDPLLGELAAVALEAARAGSSILSESYGRPLEELDTKTSATDLVSDVDRRAEAAVSGVIRRMRPEDGVLGEEGTDREGTTGVRWVVDPLDGTVNFVFGLPQFAVSVGAQQNGECVAGVVIDPCRAETWAAVKGRGSRLNGARCQIRGNDTTLATALVATGFGYRSERRRWQARVLDQVLPEVRDIRRFGAASLDLCWTADGRFDVFYEWGLNPWDLDAGALICTEAGARVEILEGRVILVAVPKLWEPMRDLLERAGGLDVPPPAGEPATWVQ